MAISRAVTDCVEVDARSNCFILFFFFLLLAKANGTNLSAPDEQADRQPGRQIVVWAGGVAAKDEIKLLLSCQLFA